MPDAVKAGNIMYA